MHGANMKVITLNYWTESNENISLFLPVTLVSENSSCAEFFPLFCTTLGAHVIYNLVPSESAHLFTFSTCNASSGGK